MTWSRSTRPRLAAKARLRRDRRSGGYMLLYPERGLALNETAAEILSLCDGQRTLGEILAALERAHEGAPSDMLMAHTTRFLMALADRGVLVEEAGP